MKEDAARATEELEKLLEQYADVTPRRDFEQLEKETAELKEFYELRLRDIELLKSEHEYVITYCIFIHHFSRTIYLLPD